MDSPTVQLHESPFTDSPAMSSGGLRRATAPDSLRWQESLRGFYDRVRIGPRGEWTHYYYKRIKSRLAGIVEPNARILDIGCGDGELLAHLRPSVGVGVDLNERVLERARGKHPHLRFVHLRGEDVDRLGETYDYVVISQALGEIYDALALFRAIRSVCHVRTRVIVVHYSRLWQPALKLMEWLGVKRRTPAEHNWLPADEVRHLLRMSGFETVRAFGMTIAPLYVPLVSALLNRVVANLPGLHNLGLSFVVVARSVAPEVVAADQPRSVSIVVPACNEAGHIGQLLRRIPQFAPRQEVIFVEGGSTDDTWEVVRETVAHYRGPFEVKCLQQDGRGKGNAVRTGFAAATGDVLMILDADISVPPEELPIFYETLLSGKGEFINGSRMVYIMDARAMRTLNIFGNKIFGWIFTYLLSQRFRDTLCGTKALTRADYRRIEANRKHLGEFDPFGDFDLLFGAAKLNLKIVDVPVHYKARTYGQTNILRFHHGWMLLRMCAFAAGKIKFV